MLHIPSICVYLHHDCNLTCTYCMRTGKVFPTIFLTDNFIRYLRSDYYERIALNGGEPLFNFPLVQEVFSYVPKNRHKVIITNGTLLTDKIVEYINKNKIEVALSHDGPTCKKYRNVDILLDKRLNDLVRNINKLTIKTVFYTENSDVFQTYQYFLDLLDNKPFFFNPNFLNATPETQYLLEGFNHHHFANQLLEHNKIYPSLQRHFIQRSNLQCVTMLDGTIYDLAGHLVGDVYTSTVESIKQKILEYSPKKCSDCTVQSQCYLYKSLQTESECTILRLLLENDIHEKTIDNQIRI